MYISIYPAMYKYVSIYLHMIVSSCPLISSRDPSVLDDCTFESEEEKSTLVVNIQHRLTPHPVKIRAGVC